MIMLLRLVPCAPDTNLRFANRRFGNPRRLADPKTLQILGGGNPSRNDLA